MRTERQRRGGQLSTLLVVPRSMFPWLQVADTVLGYHQPDHAGTVNPRRLVEAQLRITQNLGCHVFR